MSVFSPAPFTDFTGNHRELPAHISARDLDFDDPNTPCRLRAPQSRLKLAFGGNCGGLAAADELADFVIVPLRDHVEAAVADPPHRAVAVVVEDQDDWSEPEPNEGGDFHAGHLKRAVADDHIRPEVGPPESDTDARRNCETHRHVLGGGNEFRLLFAANPYRAEYCIANVSHHAAMLVEV